MAKLVASVERTKDPDLILQSAELVCRALAFSPTGLVIARFDGSCLSVNHTLASWALPPREPEAFRGSVLAVDENSAELRDALERAALGETSIVETDRAPWLGRVGRWRLHVSAFCPRDAAEAASVVFEDLTDHLMAAEVFEASERRFRTLVDWASDGIAVHRNGVLLYVNPAGARMLGYGCADEVVGGRVLDFVHPERRSLAEERIAELARSGRVAPTEQLFLRKDGSTLVVEVTASRVPLDDGLANFVFFRDVTERRQLQAELDRTSRMESLGRLAGSVAHDFNNLLGVIQGNLSIARLHLQDQELLAETLDSAEAAARRAADVTRQLLTFSRGGEAQPTLTDANRVVQEAITLVARMGANGVSIQFDADPEPASVWMGPSQLHQVFLNLLLNAKDAVAETGAIHVRTERRSYHEPVRPQARAGNWLLLRVSDNGAGMDAATRARIFEPFFTTKATGHGTGLGLSTVYGIVRQAGGWIEVDSTPGHGTCFDVYLPVGREAPAREP